MRKTQFYCLLLFCYLFSSFDSAAQKKYNVIFIAIDDLSIAFDAYGNMDAPAPNFARLMSRGMLFRQTYCQYPLCNPSRTSILSGLRPDRTNVFTNKTSPRSQLGASFKFLPEYFHDYNYRTERFGKMSCGWEKEISWDYVYKSPFKFSGGDLTNIPAWWIDTSTNDENETLAGVTTTALIKSIRNVVDTPYFYAFGIWTHNPWTPLLYSWDKIGDPSVQELLPVDIDGTITDVQGNGSANINLPDTPPNDTADIPDIALKDLINYPTDEWKRFRHAYYAEISSMDFHLGEVLDELDRLKLWDNTVVVFFSDHGVHLGEHQGLWLKQTLFEESLRVPFIICAPGKKTGVCNRPVESVDIFPTLAELCGLPAPADKDGISLVPLLENPNIKWKKSIFSQVTRVVGTSVIMGRAVRTNKFHYNSWEGNGEELYNIDNDPHEYNNLAANSHYQDVLKQMRTLLKEGWKGAAPPAYTKTTFFRDADFDNFGNSNDKIVSYFAPDGYVSTSGDCNDNNASIHPSVARINPCEAVALNGKVSSESLISSLSLSVYPNPSPGNIYLKYNSNSAGIVRLKIIDITGRLLFAKTESTIIGNNAYQINLSNLKPGVYNLELNNGTRSDWMKFVIEK